MRFLHFAVRLYHTQTTIFFCSTHILSISRTAHISHANTYHISRISHITHITRITHITHHAYHTHHTPPVPRSRKHTKKQAEVRVMKRDTTVYKGRHHQPDRYSVRWHSCTEGVRQSTKAARKASVNPHALRHACTSCTSQGILPLMRAPPYEKSRSIHPADDPSGFYIKVL